MEFLKGGLMTSLGKTWEEHGFMALWRGCYPKFLKILANRYF